MAQESNATVSFKVAFCNEEGRQTEVRRFGVELDVANNFSYLEDKIRAVFPSVGTKMLKIWWKDSDGDDIIISSNEELAEARRKVDTVDISKLYIALAMEDEEKDTTTCSVHLNVLCDGCDTQIEGKRYKCLQCEDYDLCGSCETAGVHVEHVMLRLNKPILPAKTRRFHKFCHMARSFFLRGLDTEEKKHSSRKDQTSSRTCDQTFNFMKLIESLDNFILPFDFDVLLCDDEGLQQLAQSSRGQQSKSSESRAETSQAAGSGLGESVSPHTTQAPGTSVSEVQVCTDDQSDASLETACRRETCGNNIVLTTPVVEHGTIGKKVTLPEPPAPGGNRITLRSEQQMPQMPHVEEHARPSLYPVVSDIPAVSVAQSVTWADIPQQPTSRPSTYPPRQVTWQAPACSAAPGPAPFMRSSNSGNGETYAPTPYFYSTASSAGQESIYPHMTQTNGFAGAMEHPLYPPRLINPFRNASHYRSPRPMGLDAPVRIPVAAGLPLPGNLPAPLIPTPAPVASRQATFQRAPLPAQPAPQRSAARPPTTEEREEALIWSSVEHMVEMGFSNEDGRLYHTLQLVNGNIDRALERLSNPAFPGHL